MDGLAAYGGLAAMGVTLVIAVPLYVCATASVPIAAALVASGLPTGAALVFLMAGPATNVATLGAVYRTLGRRPLAIYLSTIIVGSVAFRNGVLQVNRKVERIVPTGTYRLRILHHEIQCSGDSKRHRDHEYDHQARQRLPEQPAQ